jgi:YHS domain-containing protein
MAKCLVCHREVLPGTSGGQGKREGETYYFCSLTCKAEYDRHPETHLNEIASPPNH